MASKKMAGTPAACNTHTGLPTNPTRRRLIASAATALALPAAGAVSTIASPAVASVPEQDARIAVAVAEFVKAAADEVVAMDRVDEARQQARKQFADVFEKTKKIEAAQKKRDLTMKFAADLAKHFNEGDEAARDTALAETTALINETYANDMAEIGRLEMSEEEAYARCGLPEAEANRDAVWQRIDDLSDFIGETPAASVAGLLAKLRLVEHEQLHDGSLTYTGEYVLASVLHDLDRLFPETKIERAEA
jgi:hypothetical protein